MILSPLQARSEMAAMLARGWALQSWPSWGIALAPALEWDGREGPSPRDTTKPYAFFVARHAAAAQESLAGNGARMWSRVGTLAVQCFGSLASGQGLEDATNMATIAQRIYQGQQSDSCIWFRNAALKEVGPSGGWYQVNMTATFEYYETR